jgi:sensor histidine kinase YesM
MLLQPIVENAIVHGINARGGRGRISIETSRADGMLRLRVTDSGPGFQPTEVHHGVGLTNTQARLQQLYGSAQHIEFGRAPGGGAVVTISIPFKGSAVTEPVPIRRVS